MWMCSLRGVTKHRSGEAVLHKFTFDSLNVICNIVYEFSFSLHLLFSAHNIENEKDGLHSLHNDYLISQLSIKTQPQKLFAKA